MAGKKARFFEEDDEEAGFEQERVPLEGEEVLADVHEREPAEPGQGGGEGSEKTKSEKGGEEKSREGEKLEGVVGCAEEPSQGGEGPEGRGGSKGIRGAGEEVLGGEDAVGAVEPRDLRKEGEKGKEVREAGQAGEEPEAEGVVQEDLILTILLSRESRMMFMPG